MSLRPYEGVFYCIVCGTPVHITRISEGCECKESKFISNIDFDLVELYERMDE